MDKYIKGKSELCVRGGRGTKGSGLFWLQTREEVAHSWATQQKAVSIHCVSAGFPTRGPSAWKGECISFSWHGCLFIPWPTAPPAQKDSPYHFDVYDTHTHTFWEEIGEQEKHWHMERLVWAVWIGMSTLTVTVFVTVSWLLVWT